MATKDSSADGMQMRVMGLPPSTPVSRDDILLERLGKRPVLKRNFGFVTILGFSCTILITWEASLFVFLSGYQNGGPAGIIYGYLVVWAGLLSVFVTLSELVSMAPTSGGQYHWVAMLSPASCQKFLGYMTGWLTLTGWQAIVSSSGLLTGTLIQSLVALTVPDYRDNMQNWHGTLILWAVLLLNCALNLSFSSVFAKFEAVAFILHIVGFFAILLPLVIMGEHKSSEEVFGTFLNLGGWQTQGLSFCIGILGTAFAFLGGDGAIHMAEETRNAATVVPWSLLAGLMVNGTLGFAMLLATLYSTGDITAAVAQDPHYPFIPLFASAVGSVGGAAVMASVVAAMTFVAATGCLASTSRVYWAFARDRALPGSDFLRRTGARTRIPARAVLTAAAVAVVLSLVNVGDATAFNGVISISVAGVLGSYLIAVALLLYRRLRGDIQEPDSSLSSSSSSRAGFNSGSNSGPNSGGVTNTVGSGLTWGPWRVRGALGVANNCLSCAFLLFVVFFSFWPTQKDVTPQNMNWAVLVTVVVLLFSVVYYVAWARKVYTGPIIEVRP
ncbi:amino acid transporter [Hypoxylon sp. NC1633]|nr:amino acid transporter [Hypoxylon sp. NC1633]